MPNLIRTIRHLELKLLIRYLFGSQSDHYLSVVVANYNIASVCLKLLSSDCFDLDLPDEAIRTYVSSGTYVLQSYATGWWLEHVRNATLEKYCPQSFPKLCGMINEFIHKRMNVNFLESGKVKTVSGTNFQLFEHDWPFIYEKLTEVDRFMRNQRRMSFCLQDGKVKQPISTAVFCF